MEYEKGLRYASEIIERLEKWCSRIEIGGGIRRKKAEPHDIEIIAKPKEGISLKEMLVEIIERGKTYGDDFFDYGLPDKNGRKAPMGEKYCKIRYRNEPVDVFIVTPPAQWGVVFLIRTGSADFSHWFVQQGYSKHIVVRDGHLENELTHEIYDTPEERDAFRIMGVPYRWPEDRK